MRNFIFADPGYLFFLVFLIPLILWYVWKNKSQGASFQYSAIQSFASTHIPWKLVARHVVFGLNMLAMVLLILALARPQSTNKWKNVTSEGIDIVMALDISGSMLAEDFKPNRLEAAKDVAADFIRSRNNDRIGLIVFSGESFTQCPLTTDHAILINLFKGLKSGMIVDGTAIGLGLANAVSRIKDSKAISKVVILLTDGVNNQGAVAPLTAAEIAKVYGIRVYTIGVGTKGMAPYPVQTPFGVQYQDMPVEIDEAMLTEMAKLTGGKYFRATNNQKLKAIYGEIDKLEKSRIDIMEYKKYQEEFLWFAIPALILLILGLFFNLTILRTIP